jgi:hypothetical protein
MPDMVVPSRTPVLRALLGLALLAGCGSPPPPPPENPTVVNPVLAAPAPARLPAGHPPVAGPASPTGGGADTLPAGGAPTAAVVRPRTTAARPTQLYSGPDPCKRAVRGDSPVARACSQGGVRTAKATMKDLVRQGKAAGVNFECDDCHRDHNDHSKLAPDAPEKFQRLLSAIRR